ncbi:hypothetical protein [Specibacter cremeus]|uniref:hypothetical protein n=1 Tax=Specibacter cremeus TaxID=1629051 RepID=UPI000F7A4C57|nr:hypothetical protein [Specibacter cremeus]
MASATLQVARRGRGFFAIAPYDIVLDGTVVGSVAREETAELTVEPGHHTLRLRDGRLRSPERPFDVTENGTARFWCRGAQIWPVYVATFVKPDLGITLKSE